MMSDSSVKSADKVRERGYLCKWSEGMINAYWLCFVHRCIEDSFSSHSYLAGGWIDI